MFSRHESSIKAEETLIKSQERSGSVVVVLFINQRVAAEALYSQREYTGWRPVVAVFVTFLFLVTDILCLVIQYFGKIN